jgi:thiol:disulfide interchange protein
MKKIIFILLVFFAFAKVNAQILDHVKWTTKIEKKSEGNYVLIFNGIIEPGWHMYSQFTADGGPLALELIFKNQKGNFDLVGKANESKTKTAYNDVFEVNETFFEKSAQIVQQIKIINPKTAKVSVDLNYQVCKDVCINQEKNFTFIIPVDQKSVVAVIKADTVKVDSAKANTQLYQEVKKAPVKTDAKQPLPVSQRGLWSVFFVAFLFGFTALLTPCVFPMIPMTVSFFTKQSKTKAAGIRHAIIYGISIIVIYVTLGFLVSWIFGADALNSLATNVWFNLGFFVLLVIFATSFLGGFEIMLPNSWANKVDQQADSCLLYTSDAADDTR